MPHKREAPWRDPGAVVTSSRAQAQEPLCALCLSRGVVADQVSHRARGLEFVSDETIAELVHSMPRRETRSAETADWT